MTRRSTTLALLGCALLSTPAFALTPSALSPAGTLQRELPAADAGALREVVEPSGCTGTIIAPYAVLTANHCGAPALIRVQGAHEPGGWANYNVTGWLYNPWLQRSFWPDDWETLNNAQIAAGGRTDDWPAMHDQVVLFVPAFSPRWLADRGIVLPRIDPWAEAPLIVSGVASTGGAWRDWGRTELIDATELSITSSPRDFYGTRTCSIPGVVCTNSGDSGGPTFGVAPYLRDQGVFPSWLSQFNYGFAEEDAVTGGPSAGRFLVGTTQNGGYAGQLVSVADFAPLNYNLGETGATAQQFDTVRRNVTWLTYAAADADGDDVPYACDSNPALFGTTHNTCPASVGAPTARVADTASAMLQCPAGYVATGIAGRSGALIDQLSVKCSPVGCMASGGSCSDYLWTESFGGHGGGMFTSTCPTGTVITGLRGRKDADPAVGVAGRMTGLRAVCGQLSDVRASRSPAAVNPSTGTATFGTSGTQTWSRSCGSGTAMSALVVRTNDERWVSGVSMVCTGEAKNAGLSVGNPVAWHAQPLSCPEGSVAVGSAQAGSATSLKMFGLVCANSSLLSAGLRDDQKVVLHGQAADGEDDWVTRTSTLEDFYAAGFPSASLRLCPAGQYVTAVKLRKDGYGAGLNYVDSLTCTASMTAAKVRYGVGVGGTAGTTVQSTCAGGRAATGMVIYSGDVVEGLALTCGR